MAKLKKYLITGTSELSWTKTIEALSLKEAEEVAENITCWSWLSIEDFVEVSNDCSTTVEVEEK